MRPKRTIKQAAPNWQREQKTRKDLMKMVSNRPVPEDVTPVLPGETQAVLDVNTYGIVAYNELGTAINPDDSFDCLGDVIRDLEQQLTERRHETVRDYLEVVKANPKANGVIGKGFSLVQQASWLERELKSTFGMYYLPTQLMGQQTALELVRALVEDYTIQACPWVESNSKGDEHLVAKTPRFNYLLTSYIPPVELSLEFPDLILRLEYFEMEVKNAIREKIYELVHGAIGLTCWNVCWLQRSPGGVTFFIGPDWRVMDWEARMRSGEWHM